MFKAIENEDGRKLCLRTLRLFRVKQDKPPHPSNKLYPQNPNQAKKKSEKLNTINHTLVKGS